MFFLNINLKLKCWKTIAKLKGPESSNKNSLLSTTHKYIVTKQYLIKKDVKNQVAAPDVATRSVRVRRIGLGSEIKRNKTGGLSSHNHC